MITFIAFLLLIAGGVNWFCVGFLQYDYIAGVFGTQASLLSRLVYMFIGVATIWLLLMVVKHKGQINIFNPRFKKAVNKNDILAEQDNDRYE